MSTPNTSTSETFTFSLSSSDSGFQMSGPFMFSHLSSSWSVSGSHLDCVPTQPGLLVDYQKASLDNAVASLVVCHNHSPKPPSWSVPQLSPPVPWPLSLTGAKHTAGLVGVTTISQHLNSTDAQCRLIFLMVALGQLSLLFHSAALPQFPNAPHPILLLWEKIESLPLV